MRNLIFLMLVVVGGCAKKAHALIPLEVDGGGIMGINFVEVTVRPSHPVDTEPPPERAQFHWNGAGSTLSIGIYVAFDDSLVDVEARAYSPGVVPIGQADPVKNIRVKAGETTDVVKLRLTSVGGSTLDGAVPDSGQPSDRDHE